MKKKDFLKVGDFAKICQTTKETMLHYDRKGILKPKYIGDNGYRCYGLEQFFEYDLIALLKEAGCTLEEIKRNRESKDKNHYMLFIKEKITDLKGQQLLLAKRISMLDRMVALAEEAILAHFDRVFYQDLSEESVLYYPVDHEKMFNRTTSVMCYSSCLFDGLENGNQIDPPLGMVIPEYDCKNKNFNISYLFRYFFDNEIGNINIIKSGRYACMFHHGNMESHQAAFTTFIERISLNNLAICSDLFIFDQMNYILSGLNSTFTAKYAMLIK